jgi:hypothetical protein
LAIGAEHRSLHDAGHEVTGAPPVEVAMHASAEPPSRDPGRARSVMVVSVGIYAASHVTFSNVRFVSAGAQRHSHPIGRAQVSSSVRPPGRGLGRYLPND